MIPERRNLTTESEEEENGVFFRQCPTVIHLQHRSPQQTVLYRTVSGSQQNWVEGIEISHVILPLLFTKIEVNV